MIETAQPTTYPKQSYTTEQERDRLDVINLVVGIADLAFVIFYAVVNYQLYEATKAQFAIQQRPYMVIGDAKGILAEFCEIKGKQFIALHFANAGAGIAVQFATRSRIIVANGEAFGDWPHHRHRFVGNHGAMTVTPMNNAVDIGAKAEYTEYLPVGNSTRQQLTGTELPDSDWSGTSVDGEFEYCDDFGVYRCEKFALVYKPSIERFSPDIKNSGDICTNPNSVDLRGITFHEGLGERQIAPCKQPDEEDYEAERQRYFASIPLTRASASPTPVR